MVFERKCFGNFFHFQYEKGSVNPKFWNDFLNDFLPVKPEISGTYCSEITERSRISVSLRKNRSGICKIMQFHLVKTSK